MSEVQSSIYEQNKKRQVALNLSIKSYEQMEHITLLHLNTLLSWREYKDPLDWPENFTMSQGKPGDLDNKLSSASDKPQWVWVRVLAYPDN